MVGEEACLVSTETAKLGHNVGLPKNVANACQAETIVLALGGPFDNFTAGAPSAPEPVEHFAGARHEQNSFTLAPAEGRDVDRRRVPIAEIDPPAALG